MKAPKSAVISAGGSLEVKGTKENLDVAKDGRDILLANGVVQLKLVYRDGGYVQEFYGVDRQGRPRLLLSTIHRNLIPFTEHRLTIDPMISGKTQHLFEVNRESLRMAYSNANIVNSGNDLTVRLSGRVRDYDLTSTIKLTPGSKFVYVTVEAVLTESKRPPFIEYLMPAYAFLPDGLLLNSYSRLDYAWAPSLRPENDHIISEEAFKSPAIVVQRKKLLAALMPDPDLPRLLPVSLDLDLQNGLLSAPILAYGFCASEPDGFFSYHDRSMLLRPEDRTLKLGFWLHLNADAKTFNGFEPVQGFIWGLSSKPTPTQNEVIYRNDKSTDYIIDQALAQQHQTGLFDLKDDQRALGKFDTVLSSEVGRRLLYIHRNTGGDLRILAACRSLGDFLTAVQQPSGSIPIWFSENFDPLPELKSSIMTAAPGRFLAELYEVTDEQRYLTAAKQATRYVTNLAARNRYHDKETMLSSAINIQDLHTGILPQGADAMRHVADLMIALYQLTNDDKYLKSGLQALNQMCWLQDTWSANFGAFSSGNAYYGKISQAAFARTLLEYYAVTGRSEHIERGLAAMRIDLADGNLEAQSVQQWAIKTLGFAIIDLKCRSAYPVGLCSIDNLSINPGSISFNLKNGFSEAHIAPIKVKFRGLRGNSYRVSINGEGKHYPKVELESGIDIMI
jgi:hypothetical protein